MQVNTINNLIIVWVETYITKVAYESFGGRLISSWFHLFGLQSYVIRWNQPGLVLIILGTMLCEDTFNRGDTSVMKITKCKLN